MNQQSITLWPRTAKEYNYDFFYNQIKRHSFIDKEQDKLVSMGSCFAREIKKFLLQKEYRYLEGEKNKNPWINLWADGGRSKTDHSSIAWERVYSTFAAKQIFQYTFENKGFDRFQKFNYMNSNYVADLLRTRIVYRDMKSAEADLIDHINESKRVLTQLDVFIITLGMTEIFESKKRNIVLAFNSKGIPLEDSFQFRTGEYSENLDNLTYIYNVLKKYNPSAKMIVMVSPMHTLGTYRDDLDSYTGSCLTKSILVSSSDKFVRENKDAYYFPSYEIASILTPLLGKNPYPDGHHVSEEVIEDIFRTFEYIFKKEK